MQNHNKISEANKLSNCRSENKATQLGTYVG